MSELGKVPSFEPDEETQALIAGMFESKKEARKEKQVTKHSVSKEENPIKRHRIRIPEPPIQSKEEEDKSIKLAQQELDLIHDAFMEFSEKTSDTVIYGHLYNEILKLTEAFEDMESLITDDIDKEEMTKNTEEDYEKLRKIRARVLSDVYNKYKD